MENNKWKKSDNAKVPYLIYNAEGYAVADCKVYHGQTDITATMDLIAAAPEMLLALRVISKRLGSLTEDTAGESCKSAFGAFIAAQNAIKKATGE